MNRRKFLGMAAAVSVVAVVPHKHPYNYFPGGISTPGPHYLLDGPWTVYHQTRPRLWAGDLVTQRGLDAHGAVLADADKIATGVVIEANKVTFKVAALPKAR